MEYSKIESLGFLGPEGSYSEEVALTIKADKHLMFISIPKLLQVFYKGGVEKIILPFENSIKGIVTDSIDNLIANNGSKFVIEQELIFEVKHYMAGIDNTTNVRKIISHPQALAQCSKFVEFSGMQTEAVNSTSEAARIVAEKQEISVAAICSMRAVNIYKLSVLNNDVGDNKNNTTRFFLLGHKAQEITGIDKTFLIFQTDDRPGALLRVLQIFDSLDINMAYIQSRPSKRELGECIFLVEIEGHKDEKDVSVALEKIKGKTHFLRVLGSYSKRHLN